jgi:hypothetical protein
MDEDTAMGVAKYKTTSDMVGTEYGTKLGDTTMTECEAMATT